MYKTAFSGHGAYHRIVKSTLSIGQTDTVTLFHTQHAYAMTGLLFGKLHLILYVGSIE
jgi:hypothetical protein